MTFLATLELVRMRMLRLMQNNRFGKIWLFSVAAVDEDEDIDLEEGTLGYT